MKKPHRDEPSSFTKETNVQFLTRMMECADCGPMMQLFITQAMITYTEHCLTNEEALKKSMENGWINPESWMVAARELKKELDLRMPPPKASTKG